MITTKTRIAIIENNQAFSTLLKNMLFKVGVLSQFHFTSREKFIDQVEKRHIQFDLVIFNSSYSEKSFINLITANNIKYLAYGEREKMSTEMINLAGLPHLMELPFTSDNLLSRLEKIVS